MTLAAPVASNIPTGTAGPHAFCMVLVSIHSNAAVREWSKEVIDYLLFPLFV